MDRSDSTTNQVTEQGNNARSSALPSNWAKGKTRIGSNAASKNMGNLPSHSRLAAADNRKGAFTLMAAMPRVFAERIAAPLLATRHNPLCAQMLGQNPRDRR